MAKPLPARTTATAAPAASPFTQAVQPRSDPPGFARWLRAVLALAGMTKVRIAAEARYELNEIAAVLVAPYGTRGQRRDLYEAVLRLQARAEQPEAVTSDAAAVSVHFTSQGSGSLMAEVVHLIGSAQKEILVEAFAAAHPLFTGALLDAKRSGVTVRVIQDATWERKNRSHFSAHLVEAGIEVFADPTTAHSKVVIIDRHTVATGSFNFTYKADETNAENLVVIRDVAIAKVYARNWERSCKRIAADLRL